jgi:tetratricopeptide (TPR) repeat protein
MLLLDTQAAQRSFERATTAFQKKQFDVAAREYLAAYKSSGDATLLYNVGQSYRFGGQANRALDYFMQYIDSGQANDKDMVEVHDFIKSLRTEEDIAVARKHFEAATKAFAKKKYDVAAREYQTAYELTHDPTLLYNLGQSHRLAHHVSSALKFYLLYLDVAPVAPDFKEVEGYVAELEQIVERRAAPLDSISIPASSPDTDH